MKYGGPLEICGLICLGLACITSLSEDNQIKGLLMGVAGLFSPPSAWTLSGEMRFTFGSPQLVSGIDLMPIVVGVFPLAELFYWAYEVHANVEPTAIDCKRISFPTWQEWKGRGLILLRSSLIGVGLGILPGTGATAYLRQLLFRQAPFQEWEKLREENPTARCRRITPTTRSRAARWSPRWPSASRRARHGAHARHPDPARDHPGVR